MPSGIILSSGSQGATQEHIEKVLADNGYEAEKPGAEAPAELVEPKREDFKTEEEFNAAVDAHEAELEKREDAEEQKREEEERKRLERLPKKSRRQRAIEKATKDLEAENRWLKEQLQGKGGEGKKTAEPAPVEELKAPKREDFKSDEEFEEAKFQYRYKKQRQQEQTEDSKKAIESHQREMLANYAAAKAEIKEEHDDWDDVMKEFGESPVSSSVYVTILSLEEGPRVSYYLAKHPDELEKLNAMFPDQATREVIRLHDRLKTKTPAANGTSERPKPRPRLPDPVRPVSTAATTSTLTSRDAAKSGNYSAFKRAQRAGR